MGPRRSVVQITVPADQAELAADALWQAEPSAVATVELGDGRVRLVADVADPARVPSGWVLEEIELDGDEYLDAWRAWAAPVRIADRLVLQPAWVAPTDTAADAGPDDLVVLVDPGRTFGSGSHPSTRQVLELLLDLPVAGARVLDVGCGSGVLAVTAARLGAAEVTGIDIDPASPVTTAVNARLNGVDASVMASTTPLADVAGRFDLVLANIGAAVLCDLEPAVVRRVGPSGSIVLAGLLDDQAAAVLDAYRGWTEHRRLSTDGWTALVLRRPRP
jgi:ribosomal protein L11 methyltransferase